MCLLFNLLNNPVWYPLCWSYSSHTVESTAHKISVYMKLTFLLGGVQKISKSDCCYCCSVLQSLSDIRLFATPWTAARQASLSFPVSPSLLKLMSVESMMPSNHLILCRPLLLLPPTLPASESFPMSQLFAWGGQIIGVSASASVLPMNTQDWSPLGWTGWISLQSKRLSRVFSSTTVWKHQFFRAQPSLWSNSHIHTCWFPSIPAPVYAAIATAFITEILTILTK